MNALLRQWRAGLIAGDIVSIHDRQTGRAYITTVERTTDRMVIVRHPKRKGGPIRIMRRDGFNYGAPKRIFLDRPHSALKVTK